MSTLAQSTPFALDVESDIPLGVQLDWRLRALLLTGRLAPGEALPSLRQVAEWAGVNVNTVRSVYESLQGEGLIVSEQGRGTFVSEGIVPDPDLESIALEALRRGQDAGHDAREVAIVAMACADMLTPDDRLPPPRVEPAPDGRNGSETLEVRQELRRQIARLEVELASYVRDLPELYTATPRAKAHVAGVEELEDTRDTLIAKLSEAQKVAEQRARRAAETRLGRMGPLTEGPLANAQSWWNDASGQTAGNRRTRK
jgi:DNA-binding transcriptional regulator YhcF (GntR family)